MWSKTLHIDLWTLNGYSLLLHKSLWHYCSLLKNGELMWRKSNLLKSILNVRRWASASHIKAGGSSSKGVKCQRWGHWKAYQVNPPSLQIPQAGREEAESSPWSISSSCSDSPLTLLPILPELLVESSNLDCVLFVYWLKGLKLFFSTSACPSLSLLGAVPHP